MPTLIRDFGSESIVSTYRYDDRPAAMGEHRGCVVTIESRGANGGTFRYRLKGYARAVSDLCEGRHVRLYHGDDPQLEYEQFSLVIEANDKSLVVFCSEVEQLGE